MVRAMNTLAVQGAVLGCSILGVGAGVGVGIMVSDAFDGDPAGFLVFGVFIALAVVATTIPQHSRLGLTDPPRSSSYVLKTHRSSPTSSDFKFSWYKRFFPYMTALEPLRCLY
eukprot:Hpha_TRINITY_DN24349_c0_g1::TRINITY_DN24349_c0_g1_i1::g.147933::m.147933